MEPGPVDATVPSAHRARFVELYEQLRRIASRELGGSARTSLNTTALVHEAYLKLDGRALDASERGPFLALAAKAMRHVLVDHIRARMAGKRGGDQVRVPLATDLVDGAAEGFSDVLEVEQGLRALERLDPRLVSVVECRFFAGMEFNEIAAHLDISERTAQRDWRRARAFLQTRHAGSAP
ncbi:sigma-70 family RNA polymerase sigma factor [Luteimonas sp. BDR2-5]|uniref:ECF-type sigma factor n=1 Tax=Proluteimonas luteida TaxID=2878685 RepID=UPI001E42A355|nr:ECF-type sigma factor [Luteimonas sp. BDR2-5]MCD9027245.1 sigma-70 family RNA polymerase sigma factor [Luteimonas sp. BDR2-5]